MPHTPVVEELCAANAEPAPAKGHGNGPAEAPELTMSFETAEEVANPIGDPGDADRFDTLLSSPLIHDFPSIPLDRRGSSDTSASSAGSEGTSGKG